MRALICNDWKPFDELELGDLPVPEMRAGAVRIRIDACGISFATGLVVQGKYQRKPPRPFAPGTEVVGIVTECADDVDRFQVGDRVMAFIDTWAHRTDRGYQMVNSLIAFGSGGVTGQSLCFGGQTITCFLPEGHTDFILSVMGEQLGLIGVTSIIVLFGFVLFIEVSGITSEAHLFNFLDHRWPWWPGCHRIAANVIL